MKSTSGGEAIVNGLVAHGVDTVFGLPGAQTYGLFDAFHQAQLKVIGARHEQACGYMAFGYARSIGPARRVQRGARPRRAQCRRGAAHRVRLQRAGAVPDRAGADGVSRQGPRPSARDAGPDRDAAHVREMGRPHRISRRRACDGIARVSGDAVRAAAGRCRWKCRGTCSRSAPRSALQRCSIPFPPRSPTLTVSRPPLISSRAASGR